MVVPLRRGAAYHTPAASHHHVMRRSQRATRHPHGKSDILAHRQAGAKIEQNAIGGYVACLRIHFAIVRKEHHRQGKRKPYRTPNLLSRLDCLHWQARLRVFDFRMLVHKLHPVSRGSFRFTLHNFFQTPYGTKVYTCIPLVNPPIFWTLPPTPRGLQLASAGKNAADAPTHSISRL